MIGKKRIFAVVFTVLLFVISCSQKDQSHKKLFFWEIEYSGNRSYILGSIHYLKKDVYPLRDIIENAYTESDTLVLETNLSNVERKEMKKLPQEKKEAFSQEDEEAVKSRLRSLGYLD